MTAGSETFRLSYIRFNKKWKLRRHSKLLSATRLEGPTYYMLTQAEVFERLGRTLFLIQATERAMVACLLLIDDQSTEEGCLKKIAETDRKTLGPLIKALTATMSLRADFNMHFSSLLKRRNLLVHNLIMEDWANPKTDEGLTAIEQFLNQLLKDALEVNYVLVAFLQHHSQIGSQRPEFVEYFRRFYAAAVRSSNFVPTGSLDAYLKGVVKKAEDDYLPHIGLA